MKLLPSRTILQHASGACWGKALGAFLLLALFIASRCPAETPRGHAPEDDSALPLPRWSEEEIRAFRNNFGGAGSLLPTAEETPDANGAAPLQFGPRLSAQPGGTDGEIRPRLRAEDMRSFLPESLLTHALPRQPEAPVQPTALSALKEVTPEFLAAGAAALANEYWIDPGTLVTEMHQQEMTRFLEFHARDALIKLHVLVLPGDRKLPAGCNLDAMCSGSLAKGTACLLVYPLGEPWRARLFLSKSVHDHASQDFLQETARACVEEALHCSEVHDQLRSYSVELSTRLFWLQKALGAQLAPAPAGSRPLTEVSTTEAAAPLPAPPASGFPWLAAAMAVGVTVAAGLARPAAARLRQWQRLRRQNEVWLLPEVETVPRLGGAFSGGGGGMIRYAKAAP